MLNKLNRRPVIFIISLILMVIISGQLIITHKQNKQQTLLSTSTIHSDIFNVTKVYYDNKDNSYYMHVDNLKDLPFEVQLKDIAGDPSDSLLEDLNEAFVGDRINLKYDTKGTINQLDDEIISYSFLDNETYKQKGIIKNSILDKDDLYLNMAETEEGLYKFYSHDKLQKDQNVTLEIDNDTGAIMNVKF